MVLIPYNNNHDCIIIHPKPKPTPTPTTTITVTKTPTPSVTATVTAQPTNTPTSTRTQTPTTTKTSSQTPTTTNTRTATNTPTKTPTQTPTTTITTTPTNTLTSSPTTTPTRSNTPTRTMRPTPTPQFCKLFDIPDTFTANVIGYGRLNGQQENNVSFTKNGDTWSGSGTFPCGISYTVSMTCDPVLRKFVYDGNMSCGTGKSVIDPTDQPLILPGQNLPPIVSYSDLSNCPPPCFPCSDQLPEHYNITAYINSYEGEQNEGENYMLQLSAWNNTNQIWDILTVINSDGTPTNKPQWTGDLKNYIYKSGDQCIIQIGVQELGTGDGDVNIRLVDQNNNTFTQDYWSYWNPTITIVVS